MQGSYISFRVHLVWATRRRRPMLDPEWRTRLWAQIAACVVQRGGRLLCAGGARDHVHLYLELPPTVALVDMINGIKAHSTRWIHEAVPHRRDFRWQAGYAAFSVNPARDAELQDYIRNQETHHRDRDFAAEYVGLLDVHGIEYDLRYALD
jgi:putative transposase